VLAAVVWGLGPASAAAGLAVTDATPEVLVGSGAPQLEFVETDFDFGEVYEGDQVVHRFRLRNGGDADLVVGPIQADSLRPFCGLGDSLIVAPATRKGAVLVIPPGGTEEIVASFNSEGFAARNFDGRVAQQIMVYSNDLSRPRVALQVRGRVKAVLVADPPMVALGNVYKADGELPRYLPPVRLTATPGHSFAVTKVETNSRYLRPVATPVSADEGGGYLITTQINPEIPEGDFGGVHLLVHTTEARKRVVNVPVSGHVHPERLITVTPRFVDFGLLRPGQERTATMRVAKGQLTNWNIPRVEWESLGTPIHGAIRRVGSDYEVTVSIKAPERPLEPFRGVVRLVTDNVRQPRVEIPIVGWTYADDPFSSHADRLKAFVADVLKEELLQQPREILTTALAGVRDRRATEVLLGVFRDGEWLAKLRAAELLAELGHVGAVEVIEASAREDEDADVREEALAALARLAPERALPALLRGLEDEDSSVRERVVALLSELGDRRAVPALLRALRDTDQDVAVAAGNAVESLVVGRPQPMSK
jgi:hypothetical protein